MRIQRLIYGTIWAAICLPLDAHAARNADGMGYVPDCAGRVEIAHARVVRVEQNGALILSDGRSLLLEGVRLPLSDAPRPIADQALAALRQMAQDGPVTFTATPPKEDRYDRIRVQGFGKQWFQMALLEQGLARVAIAPDRNECAPDFYEAETRARGKHLGIWALAGFQARAPDKAKGTSGTFQLIDGWVTNVATNGGRTFIDFGSNGQHVFSAIIAPDDRRAFRDFDLPGLNARHIRIRGIVQDYRGRPEIALSNPSQIEVLD